MTTFYSYSRTEQRTKVDVAEPRSVAELIELVKGWHDLAAAGPAVVVRARRDSQAMHDQALGPADPAGRRVVYLMTNRLRKSAEAAYRLRVTEPAEKVPGEAWTRAVLAPGWAPMGDVFDAAVDKGFIPYVVPTSRRITVGGAVGTNALSRFSLAYGKFDEVITWVRLLRADGSVVRLYQPDLYVAGNVGADIVLSPEANAELFHAVLGGHGMLGFVLQARIGLLDLGQVKDLSPGANAPLRSVTACTSFRGPENKPLSWVRPTLERFAKIAWDRPITQAKLANPAARLVPAAWGPNDWTTIGMLGMTTVDKNLTGALYHMSFARKKRRVLDHQFKPWARKISKVFQEVSMRLDLLPGASAVAERAIFDQTWKASGVDATDRELLWDRLCGATFMMEAHTMAAQEVRKKRGREDIGSALQITYAFPMVEKTGEKTFDVEHVVQFFAAARALLLNPERAAIPNVCDFLYLPAGVCPLAPNFGAPVLVLTFALEGLSNYRKSSGEFDTVQVGHQKYKLGDTAKILEELSRLALDCGGRISLSKTVLVTPDVLHAMYGERIAAFLKVKAAHDPNTRWDTGHHRALVAARDTESAKPRVRVMYTLGSSSDVRGVTLDELGKDGMWTKDGGTEDKTPYSELPSANSDAEAVLEEWVDEGLNRLQPGAVRPATLEARLALLRAKVDAPVVAVEPDFEPDGCEDRAN